MIQNLALNFTLDLILIALPIAILAQKQKSTKKAIQELGFKPISLVNLIKKTGILFLALIAASIWLNIVLTLTGINDLERVTTTVGQAKAATPLLLWIIAVRVVGEETFFRGLLVKRIGIIASSGIFALSHIGYWSAAEIIGALVLGIILAKAFQLNKNIYPNILAHMAYNVMAIAAI